MREIIQASPHRRRRSLSGVPGDGTVFDVDGRGVAQDHLGAALAAGGLDGGGRGAATDQFRGEAAATGVRRDVDLVQDCGAGEVLYALVDLAGVNATTRSSPAGAVHTLDVVS